MSYVEVCDHIEAMIEAEEKGDTSIFTFKKLLGHEVTRFYQRKGQLSMTKWVDH